MENKKFLTESLKKKDLIVGCYDDGMEQLTKAQLKRVLEKLEYNDYCDVIVYIKKKKYVVEIATVDNEVDFILTSSEEYKVKYGREVGK